MLSEELKEKFKYFFEKRGHKLVPSSSLIPDDETVLLTSAGMQQFVPFLSGEKDVKQKFGSIHLVSIQKCFRSADIEEIGDDTHHTFFEMFGNWSIGENKEGYFKQGAVDSALDFFVNEIGLPLEKLYVTVFKGNKDIPADSESMSIWLKKGISQERISEFGEEDNFWGPTATTGPCGPCSEIHYDRGEKYGCKMGCGPNCDKCKRFVELWNLVFMEYNKNEDGSFTKLPQRNVDTGIGFERLLALLQDKDSAYETDLFMPVIKSMEKSISYEENKRAFRIIADHLRGAVFLITDGVVPGKKEEGYILRRIIRRAIRFRKEILLNSFDDPLQEIIKKYSQWYPEINKDKIFSIINKEEESFQKTLREGIEKLNKISKDASSDELGKQLFFIYQSYGFPLDMSLEEIGITDTKDIREAFNKEFKKHQQVSRKGSEEKFGGLRKGAEGKEVMFHTATHLLHQALRNVLGDEVRQMGSDINKDRLRFDFSYGEKMTKKQIEDVENIVNQNIDEGIDVVKEEMNYQQAVNLGALAFFKDVYPDTVTVYSVGNFSKEVCGGPHVSNTSELGKFKILKEESSSAGVRRIKATLY